MRQVATSRDRHRRRVELAVDSGTPRAEAIDVECNEFLDEVPLASLSQRLALCVVATVFLEAVARPVSTYVLINVIGASKDVWFGAPDLSSPPAQEKAPSPLVPEKPEKKPQVASLTDQQVAQLLKTHKKCTGCNEWKERNLHYHESQGRCKECSNLDRGLKRLAESQGMRSQLDSMQSDEGKLYSAMLKGYSKERQKIRRVGAKLKFSINEFVVEYKARVGSRAQEEGEMMWEGEYYEFARSIKMGSLSRSEAEQNWISFLEDPSIPKDWKGPRGYQRVWIKVRDTLSKFSETSEDKSLRREEKLGKAPKEQTLDVRRKLMFSAGPQIPSNPLECLGLPRTKSMTSKVTPTELYSNSPSESNARSHRTLPSFLLHLVLGANPSLALHDSTRAWILHGESCASP
eukprot:3875094-Amphidinium_carterae.1